MKPGDRITAIDGRPAGAFSLDELVRLLKSEEGRTIELRVSRNGEEREHSLALKRAI